jgi:hypothetical protein
LTGLAAPSQSRGGDIVRPTYGPGPRSAVIAALFVWAMILVANLSLVLLTNVTLGLVATLHGPNLAAVITATLAGAWLYRDPSSGAAADFAGEAPTEIHAAIG